MAQSLVTIIVPIYNVEKYLDRCVQSVVSQTYKNIEIILVDDGSPDNCPTKCDEWAKKDSRIRVIHKQNEGLGMARNTGIDNAKGKYVFFFDSDDYVDVEIVEKCVLSAEKYSSDAVVYGRCDVYEDGRIVKKELNSTKSIFIDQDIINELLPAMFTYDMGFGISAWGKMFSLEVFKRFDMRFASEREIISEDAYFALEFFSRISVVSIVNESLYFYYKRADSLSRSFREDRFEKINVFYKTSINYINMKNLPGKVIAHFTVRYHMYVISAMKQLLASDWAKVEKKTHLNAILRDETLHFSLTKDVFRVHKNKMRLFFKLLRLKLYPCCKVLLRVKNKIG